MIRSLSLTLSCLLCSMLCLILVSGPALAKEKPVIMAPPTLMEESGDVASALSLTIAQLMENQSLSKKEHAVLNKLLAGPVAGKLLVIGDARASAIAKNKPVPSFSKIQGAKQLEIDAIMEWGGHSLEELEALHEQMQNDLDSMSEMSEMESLRLQQAMDRLSKMMSTLSNLLKKSSETKEGITQNMK